MVDLPRVRSIIWSTGGSSTLEKVKEARRLRGREGGCRRDCECVWKRRERSSGVLEEREKEALRSRDDDRRRRRSNGLVVVEEELVEVEEELVEAEELVEVEEQPLVVNFVSVGSITLSTAAL